MQYHALSVAILQILYIIATIGYIYRRKYERMRERDKNDIHVSFANYLCQFMRTLPQGQSDILMRDIKQLMRDCRAILMIFLSPDIRSITDLICFSVSLFESIT